MKKLSIVSINKKLHNKKLYTRISYSVYDSLIQAPISGAFSCPDAGQVCDKHLTEKSLKPVPDGIMHQIIVFYRLSNSLKISIILLAFVLNGVTLKS